MIRIYAWDKNTKTGQILDASALRERRDQLRATQEVVWIDLENPSADEEDLVFKQFFPVHSLTLEDITRLRREPDAPPHFPKVEEFADYLFVIINPLSASFFEVVQQGREPARGVELKPFTQLSVILTHQLLITHHYEPMSCVAQPQTFLARHEVQADRGPDYLFHLILDTTVDQYGPVLDHIEDVLDGMELQVVRRPSQKLFLRLLRLKRRIIQLRKTLIHEREVLVRLARGEFVLIDEREAAYYRNVYDHLSRFAELIDSAREMASDLMQSYLAAISNKLNEIMKVLTMISTTVLPMTLIAGVYGMNVESLPGAKEWWGLPVALALMALTGVASMAFFWWKRWL